jgi:hypothetical protein
MRRFLWRPLAVQPHHTHLLFKSQIKLNMCDPFLHVPAANERPHLCSYTDLWTRSYYLSQWRTQDCQVWQPLASDGTFSEKQYVDCS